MLRVSRFLGVPLVLATSAVPAFAGITYAGVFKSGFYLQNSPSAPTTANEYAAFFNLASDTDDDAITSRVLLPGGGVVDLAYAGPRFMSEDSPGFASEAALEAVYGPGDYKFEILTGNLGGTSADLTVPAPAYPVEIPSLSAASYNGLQGLDPASIANVSWAGFNGSLPDAVTFFSIYDEFGNLTFQDFGDPTAFTSTSIPAGTLVPSTLYFFSLAYSNREETSTSGFGGSGNVLASLDRTTYGAFTTVPEPASLAVLGLGLLAIRRKKAAVGSK